jgi:hypothetical protein
MLTGSPSAALDLLVVGGLTVDVFEDGSTAAGGAVLHAALSAHAAGLRVGVAATAGPEPEVRAAAGDLGALDRLELSPVARSIGFEHRNVAGGRRLRYLGGGGPVPLPRVGLRAGAVLFAPVAGEVGPELLDLDWPGARRGAVLQGWLRRLDSGATVLPIELARLPRPLVAALRGLDLLVASREDLVAEADAPPEQLDALRDAFGPTPVLVVTDAESGLWVDVGARGAGPLRWREPVSRLVHGVSSVGAGDMLAALLLGARWPSLDDPAELRRWAAAAMNGVAERLAERR